MIKEKYKKWIVYLLDDCMIEITYSIPVDEKNVRRDVYYDNKRKRSDIIKVVPVM